MMHQEPLLNRTWSYTSPRGWTCLIDLMTFPLEVLLLAMLVTCKICDCHGSRLRAGQAVFMALIESWTRTSLACRCERIATLSDENRGTSGVRLPDKHSNESRTTPSVSCSSCAVRVLSCGTGFPTIVGHNRGLARCHRPGHHMWRVTIESSFFWH